MKIGDKLPNIKLEATGEQSINLAKIKGQKVVVYFYPKDSTPGCTTEGQNFRDLFSEFESHNCIIFGVSRDSIKSHERFKEKQAFPFDLLSDPDEALCKAFDVIKLKKMYGKEYLGVERSTFLFDEKGKLAHEWRKVRVKGHVDEVLEAVSQL
ncbi:peroxiredoxin [Aliikangiella marina]|uniref:thioredoxin-dependent peroxiredoxin n=1 Tax=Aliikangiella marina TaxID=1712262 RepID=A0A545TJV3_9GAMM|nr:peroxiredoxin [Aliikangiella marina]TQV77488.1 peroxiredoxin [Aliikangiella marina]